MESQTNSATSHGASDDSAHHYSANNTYTSQATADTEKKWPQECANTDAYAQHASSPTENARPPVTNNPHNTTTQVTGVAHQTIRPMHTLHGIGAAIPTLADDRGAIDTNAHQKLARHLKTQGAQLILVGGTTGRGNTLGVLQRIALCETTTPTLPVICGIPHDRTNQIEQIAKTGAKAALIGWPHNTPVDNILHTNTICQTHGLQLVCYQHTAHNVHINPNWATEMAKHGIMAKHSDPTANLAKHLAQQGVGVFIGSTQLLPHTNEIGAIGVLNGAASIMFPTAHAATNGDNTAHQQMLDWETTQHANRIGAIEHTAWNISRNHT